MTFYDAGSIVCHALCRVSLDSSLGVLGHYEAVLVINIGDSKGLFIQAVKESFLGIAVVLESLMIIQMISCKIGEDASGKGQTANSFLCNSVA